MSTDLFFRRLAAAEFTESTEWYENQQAGLGAEFASEVGATLEAIAQDPMRYPVVLKDIREAIVSRFPYAVYYRIKPDRVIILAVFHCSRDPAIWQNRN